RENWRQRPCERSNLLPTVAIPMGLASSLRSRNVSRGEPSASRKVQLDHDIVVVREEKLVDRRSRDMVLAVSDAVPFELRLDAVEIARQKRKMVERPRVARRPAADRVLARDEGHDRHIAAIEPISREFEIRPEADLEPQHIAIEIAGRFEIVGLDRDMVQYIDPHGSLHRASR